jgi:hypothetical protein
LNKKHGSEINWNKTSCIVSYPKFVHTVNSYTFSRAPYVLQKCIFTSLSPKFKKRRKQKVTTFQKKKMRIKHVLWLYIYQASKHLLFSLISNTSIVYIHHFSIKHISLQISLLICHFCYHRHPNHKCAYWCK